MGTERIPEGVTEIPEKYLAPLALALDVGIMTGRAFDDLKRALAYGADKDPVDIIRKLGDGHGEVPAHLKLNPEQFRMLHAAMGMMTEACEFLEIVAANLRDGKPFDRAHILEELGDSSWYQAIPVNIFNLNWDQILQANIDKLRARYPDKFEAHRALNRDLTAERAILDNAVNSETEPRKAL